MDVLAGNAFSTKKVPARFLVVNMKVICQIYHMAQHRITCDEADKAKWLKAAQDWAKPLGLPADRCLAAWTRSMLNKAAEEQLKDSKNKKG